MDSAKRNYWQSYRAGTFEQTPIYFPSDFSNQHPVEAIQALHDSNMKLEP